MAENAVLTGDHPAASRRSRADEAGTGGGWISALRRYLVAIALGNLIWEFAQLPLYTVWQQGSARDIVAAAVHCTGGDILIAGSSLIAALIVAGSWSWPRDGFYIVAVLAVLGGLAYTIFSEWLNTEIRGSWAYSDWMPTLPLIGAGLSPFAQWIAVPAIAFWWARRPPAVADRERRKT